MAKTSTTPAAKAASKAKANNEAVQDTEATTQEATTEQASPETTVQTKKAAPKKITKAAAKKMIMGDAKSFDLQDTSTAIEVLGESDILNLIPELIDETGVNDFKLGGALLRVQENKWYIDAEYESFKAYCDDLFSGGYRKAMYLITIYKGLVEKEIPWDAVKHVGWSKLKEIICVIEKDTAADWAEKATSMTLVQLAEYVRAYLKSQSDNSESAGTGNAGDMSTLAFRLFKDQRDVVETAIENMKVASGDADMKKEVAITSICEEYLAGGEPKAKDPKKELAKIAKSLGWEDALTIIAELFDDEIDVNVSKK